LESVVGFGWNAWSVSVGIGGRHQLEFMVGLGWNMQATLRRLVDIARRQRLTLVYSSKHEDFNNATVLKEYLETLAGR